MTKRNGILFVLGLFIFLYILPLGIRPLITPDETRYAEIPREMIASGDFIVPRLNGLVYFEKPVMGYWLHAVSLLTFGENNFAVRLPSALATGCSALFIFLLAYREEDPLVAPLAACIYLSCLEVFGIGTFAVLDSILTCFITGSLFFFYKALTSPPRSNTEKKMLIMGGVFCGLAFLTKGFLAFVIPTITLLGFLIWQGRFTDIIRIIWLPLLAILIVAAPWSLTIHHKAPDFWHYFFWEEHIRRFMGNNAQHKESLWSFLSIVPLTCLPWIFLTPAAISGLRQKQQPADSSSGLTLFVLCWLILPFTFFSVSSGKLLTYILPCFPPYALLMAIGLNRYFNKTGHRRLFQWGTGGLILLATLLIGGLPALQLFDFIDFKPYSQQWKWQLVTLSLFIMICCLITSRRKQKTMAGLYYFGMAPLALYFSAAFAVPTMTLAVKNPGILLNRHLHDIHPETLIVSGEESIRAVCWYFKRDDIIMLHSAGELEYGNNQSDENRMQTINEIAKLIKQNRGHIVLVLRQKKYNKWQIYLPEPIVMDTNLAANNRGYIFLKY